MAMNVRVWTCPECKRVPGVNLEMECPACREVVTEFYPIEFFPTGTSRDHDLHAAEESKYAKRYLFDSYYGDDYGTFRKDIPNSFKAHIEKHEAAGFNGGS